MGVHVDAELYLRLEGERALLDPWQDFQAFAAVAAALSAIGRIPVETATAIAADYATAAGGDSVGRFLSPDDTNTPGPSAIQHLHVVACNLTTDGDGGRVLYPFLSITDAWTRALMIVEGVSKQAASHHAGEMSIVDDAGHAYVPSIDGTPAVTGGPDTFSAYVSTPIPMPESARWVEVNGTRIDLRADDPRRPSVEVEDRIDSSPAERYLDRLLARGQNYPAPSAESVARALVACGEIGPDHPLLEQVVAAAQAQGPPGPRRFRSAVNLPAQGSESSSDVYAVAVGAVVSGVDAVTFGLEALLMRPSGFQIGVLLDAPTTTPVPGWPTPQSLIQWDAEDDLGHTYQATLGNLRQRGPSRPADADLVFSPALDAAARLLRLTATGVNQTARIVVTIRSSEW